jgi:RNA polymerase sigma-70 factor (ECF subfamily)
VGTHPDTTISEPPEIAIPKLLDEHGGKIYRLGVKLCGSTDDAEDLVQESFMQAFRAWSRFRGEAKPSTWLYTIAARACQRMKRRRAGEPEHIISWEKIHPFAETKLAALDLSGGVDSPVARQLQSERIEQLEQAIVDLPLMYRLPLVLKDVLELTVSETAEALGLKPETVKTRVHRARLLLRKVLLADKPTIEAPAPVYSRQVCLDLLRAKQDAMDEGRGFPIGHDVVCERCLAVFDSLDIAQDMCARLADGKLPAAVRRAVLASIDAKDQA